MWHHKRCVQGWFGYRTPYILIHPILYFFKFWFWMFLPRPGQGTNNVFEFRSAIDVLLTIKVPGFFIIFQMALLIFKVASHQKLWTIRGSALYHFAVKTCYPIVHCVICNMINISHKRWLGKMSSHWRGDHIKNVCVCFVCVCVCVCLCV